MGLEATAAELTLHVSDSGVAPSPQDLGELFRPFGCANSADSPQGDGMNLALARGWAEAMGGRLEAAASGQGLDLALTLARAVRREAPMITAPNRPLPNATLLYVEDNPSNIALMRQVIAALGPLTLHVAETGPEGLTLARDLRPDVVILDINLPGMDGIELKARLDSDPLTRDIPVIALSASTLPDDLARAQASGFSTYLAKPLHVPALLQALQQALDHASSDGADDEMRPRDLACA
nr:response regulator [Brevundimonas sp. PAMC22021]